MTEFKAWTYAQARAFLWPAEKLPASWVPGNPPPRPFRTPVDDSIEELQLAGRLRDKIPPFAAGAQGQISRRDDLNEFCPFRETRSHWIPFALQVARLEEERHQRRVSIRGRLDTDIESALEALKNFVHHDVHETAGVERALLSPPTASLDTEVMENQLVRDLPEAEQKVIGRPPTNEEAEMFGDFLLVRRAMAAKEAASNARVEISALKSERRLLYVPRADFNQWNISFVHTLGFAWRRFTGVDPSRAPESPFSRFVDSAYQSLARDEELFWNHPCRFVAEHYARDFSYVDRDPPLVSRALPIWEEILKALLKRTNNPLDNRV